MTIPNTNVSLQDFNRNLRRPTTNTINFGTGGVGSFNIFLTDVSFGNARSRLSNPLDTPPGWSWVFDFDVLTDDINDYCRTLVFSGEQNSGGAIVNGRYELSNSSTSYILASPAPTNVNLAAYNGPWALNLIVNSSSTSPTTSRFVTLGPGGDVGTSSIRYDVAGSDIVLQFFCFDQNSNFTSISGGSHITNTDMTVKVTRLGTTITLLQNGTQIGTATVASNATFDFSRVRLGDASVEFFSGSIKEFSMSRLGV
jgi:hypothetical protein